MSAPHPLQSLPELTPEATARIAAWIAGEYPPGTKLAWPAILPRVEEKFAVILSRSLDAPDVTAIKKATHAERAAMSGA